MKASADFKGFVSARVKEAAKKSTKGVKSKPQAETHFQPLNGTTELAAEKIVRVDKSSPQRLEAALILRDLRHE